MSKSLFQEFEPAGKEAWIAALKKELKGDDFEARFHKKDEIEEIEFPSYFHREDAIEQVSAPGKYPYRRGNQPEGNDWQIMSAVQVVQEEEANKQALELLMTGTNTIVFQLSEQSEINYELLLKEIGLEHVQVAFQYHHEKQLQGLQKYLTNKKFREIFLMPLHLTENNPLTFTSAEGLVRSREVNGYEIQQAGANAAQEIAFVLCRAHELLIEGVNQGNTVDDVLASLHFTLGVGSDYLIEIAKFRALRQLWARIAHSYAPQHGCNETISITARIGFMNKSLCDPYTNLLRQTTEAMSAVLGGAAQLWIQAYDALSQEGASRLSSRMATNISLILKEESYLHLVQDATGGSYAVEQLTDKLCDSAWKRFQEMEANGGTQAQNWRESIRQKAQQRIDLLAHKQRTLIGINKFPDPQAKQPGWKQEDKANWGLKALNLESAFEAVKPMV